MSPEKYTIFMQRIRYESDCWVWTRALDNGYGRFCIESRTLWAHRVSYEHHVGPIPKGLFIDHLCRNRACQNPAHMEVVSNVENTLRGVGITALNSKKTHCLNGHRFSLENTRLLPTRRKSGVGPARRFCRACGRDRWHALARAALNSQNLT